LCLCLSACSGQETQQQTSSQLNSSQEQSDTGVDDAGSSDKVMTDTAESDAAVSLEAEEESMGRKLKLTVEGQELSITLFDTPAANALYDMLPLELTFEDFNGVEKISYLTDELPTEGGRTAVTPMQVILSICTVKSLNFLSGFGIPTL
ncbi:MAG: cyclophilin-like fold protein, partial [Lachnospiraceae bacterium]